MDLSPAMLRYRECARHVWNVFFQPMPEGWHEFINVDHALFEGLVLSLLKEEDRQNDMRDGYWPAIAVIPGPSVFGLPAMHVRPESGKTNQWQQFILGHDSIDLRFIEFFDFANYNDPRDFKHVRARVVGPATHELLGHDVLLETEHAGFEAGGTGSPA